MVTVLQVSGGWCHIRDGDLGTWSLSIDCRLSFVVIRGQAGGPWHQTLTEDSPACRTLSQFSQTPPKIWPTSIFLRDNPLPSSLSRPTPKPDAKMSEYWKSTPKYWCKHCALYVRDTKLERQNHEATGKHQGAIRRSLRDIHRAAEQAERDRDRARREVDRLNGVVSSSVAKTTTATTAPGSKPAPAQPQLQVQQTEAERKKQLEQLEELGVAIPRELRGEVAMAGEWTVTATRVVQAAEGEEDVKNEARATGIKRERERTEEEREQDEAIKGLFGKRRKWGVDSKVVGGEEDGELEELLRGGLGAVKKEEGVNEQEVGEVVVKKEEHDGEGLGDAVGAGDAVAAGSPDMKTEVGTTETPAKEEGDPAAVVFKKRKPKNIRQK